MTIRPLVLFPDDRLSVPCKPVVHFDESLKSLIRDLKDTMYASPGVGLAAPQIGIQQQVSVIDTARANRGKPHLPSESHGFLVLINPVLLSTSGSQTPREGCLSIPDWLANVQRYEKVTVQTLNLRGESHVITSTGFEALALQHEIDHLHGVLFLDRVVNLKTDVFRRKKYG